ncbi:hypothetical protein ABN702_05795 [Bacillus haimaensis]|uniref:hypothetical protein n=1 Tax=Bacillus haimaensis TaxID=3160967 RepID=UPI003AA7BC47
MDVRDNYIAKVRERCQEYKLDPNVIPVFNRIPPEELARIQDEYEDTLHIIRMFMDKFLGKSKGIPLLVAVTDDKGKFIEYMGMKACKIRLSINSDWQRGFNLRKKKRGSIRSWQPWN